MACPPIRSRYARGVKKKSVAPEDDVEAAAAAMATMRAAHRGDRGRMARDREPVMNRGADPAALDRRIAGAMMAGDQQDDPRAVRNRALQRAVDRGPGAVEG